MPVVIFFACLDLEQKSLFIDGHYLVFERKPGFFVKVKEDQNFNRRNTSYNAINYLVSEQKPGFFVRALLTEGKMGNVIKNFMIVFLQPQFCF